MSWLLDFTIVLAAAIVLWVLAVKVLCRPRAGHTGEEEHPLGSVPDCAGCRDWLDR